MEVVVKTDVDHFSCLESLEPMECLQHNMWSRSADPEQNLLWTWFQLFPGAIHQRTELQGSNVSRYWLIRFLFHRWKNDNCGGKIIPQFGPIGVIGAAAPRLAMRGPKTVTAPVQDPLTCVQLIRLQTPQHVSFQNVAVRTRLTFVLKSSLWLMELRTWPSPLSIPYLIARLECILFLFVHQFTSRTPGAIGAPLLTAVERQLPSKPGQRLEAVIILGSTASY